ncbi:MAG: Uncharacterised protein [Opitutia bacterium UBA7350]|nr:MAG: Uncharacterised protein [Opitutae bacterium UBA7350]
MLDRLLPLTIFFLTLIRPLCAQDAITVDRVKFNTLGDRWVQVEIELTCNGNIAPDAVNADYLENIMVKPLLAYRIGSGEYRFYTAQVEIMIMEARDKNTVYFYMPGLIMERDEIRGEPEFYYIEVSIAGEAQEPQKSPAMGNIRDLEMLKNMQSKANAQVEANKNILIPSYLAPPLIHNDFREEPLYLRREPTS